MARCPLSRHPDIGQAGGDATLGGGHAHGVVRRGLYACAARCRVGCRAGVAASLMTSGQLVLVSRASMRRWSEKR